ncbi:hypothetical protein VCV18_002698 [Metarhizium anisopliae]
MVRSKGFEKETRRRVTIEAGDAVAQRSAKQKMVIDAVSREVGRRRGGSESKQQLGPAGATSESRGPAKVWTRLAAKQKTGVNMESASRRKEDKGQVETSEGRKGGGKRDGFGF